MSASTEIIERIKKLLRLARSSNPHEAELAMQRAMELAAENDIAVDRLDPDEQAKEKAVTHRDSTTVLRMSYDKEYAVRIVKAFFHVTPVFNQKIGFDRCGTPFLMKFVTFVGTAANVEVALYVYEFLYRHFAFCWRKHRGRLRNRHAFVDGMFRGLFWKLHDQRPPNHAKGDELVLAEHQRYIASFIGETEKSNYKGPPSDSKAASLAGFIQGEQTIIAPAIKAGVPARPLVILG